MTIAYGPGSIETEVLSREAAKLLALDCKNKPDPLKGKRIPPSLLSAEHIRDYILATGLVSPFFLGGEKPRLKKASYEGRIGKKAFEFENGVLRPIPLDGGSLVVKANSIVFVESDLDFRLPEYIALRFNLHITHVHRGLLLGTGPLVDPAFWGKLCIPLHNLTSQDYEIATSEGLIWIEFTKTTSRVAGEQAIGAPPSNTEFWEIESFIRKAARGVGGISNVAIQSSIPVAVSEANDRSKVAGQVSDNAITEVRALQKTIFRFGAVGVIGTVIAVGALLFAYWQTSGTQTQMTKEYVDSANLRLEDLRQQLTLSTTQLAWAQERIETGEVGDQRMSERLQRLEQENETLRSELQALNQLIRTTRKTYGAK